MADESKIIEDGQSLGYSGDHLIKYVTERVAREEQKLRDSNEREERFKIREQERINAEQELKRQELDLERLRLESRPTPSETISTHGLFSKIPLNPYKDGDDLAIFLKTFERVKLANRWSESSAI